MFVCNEHLCFCKECAMNDSCEVGCIYCQGFGEAMSADYCVSNPEESFDYYE